ncbi:MAG: hypothetical protein ACYTF0_03490 [Planctomycetota bacterium]|jgi:hypothetical protein
MPLTVHQLPLLIAGLGVVAAGAALVLRDDQSADLAAPRIAAADAVREVHLDLPPIRAFEHYYGDETAAWSDLNPFIPFAQRAVEREALARRETDSQPQPTERDLPPPPRKLPPLPELVLPELPEPEDMPPLALPRVVGFIDSSRGPVVQVRFAPDGAPERLRLGERRHGWAVEGIDGSEVVFVDEAGRRLRATVAVAAEGDVILPAVAAKADDGVEPATNGDDQPASEPRGGRGQNQRSRGEELLRKVENHPLGRIYLKNNPQYRDMILTNPDEAAKVIEQFMR